jgi:YVTN family beta-propeller protein
VLLALSCRAGRLMSRQLRGKAAHFDRVAAANDPNRTSRQRRGAASVATIDVGLAPFGVAVTPDGSKVYVANLSNTVSVISTATNVVSATISVGDGPVGVAFTPDGSRAYVANQFDHTVAVIATASNTVVATIKAGTSPIAFGIFIRPRFAGAQGSPNLSRHWCLGTRSQGLNVSQAVSARAFSGSWPSEVRMEREGFGFLPSLISPL